MTLVRASSRMARLSVGLGVGGGQRRGGAEPAARARQLHDVHVQAELGAASGDGSAELGDVRAAVDPLEPDEQSPAADVADQRMPLGELVQPAAQAVIKLSPPCSDVTHPAGRRVIVIDPLIGAMIESAVGSGSDPKDPDPGDGSGSARWPRRTGPCCG